MTQMTVARLHGAGDLRLTREPIAQSGDGQSLIRVGAVGLCGSDLHWFSEGGIGDAVITRPVVPGHEFAGTVVGGPLDGQRVAVDPALPCGACESCLNGHPNLCPTVGFAGHGQWDGPLREYLSWRTDRLHAVPPQISDAGAAMLEPLGVAIHAFDLGHVTLGATVAVVGCGPIGLLLIQVARAGGAARVVAVEPLQHRRAAALRAGADVALSPDEARTGWHDVAGMGVDVAFEVAGNDDAIHQSVLAARPGARIVLVGIPADDRSSFPAGLARRKGLTMALARRMKEVYPRAIDLVVRGAVDVESLVSARYPLDRAADAFADAAERRGLKVVIDLSLQPRTRAVGG